MSSATAFSGLRSRIDLVPVSFRYRDPDDEPYLNLAIAVSADYLVTRDNDLLDLMQDSAFRVRFPSLTILDPVTALRLLDSPHAQA